MAALLCTAGMSNESSKYTSGNATRSAQIVGCVTVCVAVLCYAHIVIKRGMNLDWDSILLLGGGWISGAGALQLFYSQRSSARHEITLADHTLSDKIQHLGQAAQWSIYVSAVVPALCVCMSYGSYQAFKNSIRAAVDRRDEECKHIARGVVFSDGDARAEIANLVADLIYVAKGKIRDTVRKSMRNLAASTVRRQLNGTTWYGGVYKLGGNYVALHELRDWRSSRFGMAVS